MKPILLYLLQVIICSGLLYGYYHLLLRNKKFHQYNRFYLLAAAVISMLVPFLNIPVYFSNQESKPVWLQSFNDLSSTGQYIFAGAAHDSSYDFFTWNNLLVSCYVLALLLLLYRLVNSVRKIRKMTRTYHVEKLDEIYFINTEEQGTPFSFFRWLFWNNKIQLDSPDGQQIFRHELFHINQKHSRDIIFMEILSVVFWINPFFHLIKKELTTIHEFLADQFAAKENEKWNYAELLLMHLLGSPNLRLTHPFFHNQIKRRIAMITSSQQPKYRYFRKMLVLPLLALIAGLFAFTYKQKQPPGAVNDKLVSEISLTDSLPGTIKELPEAELIIVNGKKYTKAEADKILEKKIMLATGAVIYTKPGDTLAIKKYGAAAKNGVIELREVEVKSETPKKVNILKGQIIEKPVIQPLYVIDGVVQPKDVPLDLLNNINPNDIQSVTILKDKNAFDKYGKDAANGVIEMITKGQKEPEALQLKLQGIKIDSIKGSLSEVVVVGYKSGNGLDQQPSFPGGESAWRKFLERNMNANVPVNEGAEAGKYIVRVQFIVDPEGNISDIKPLTKNGYGMEEEVIRVLTQGPRWEPGKINGKAVKAYKQQPVTFVIETENEPDLKEVVVVGYKKEKPVVADIDKLSPIYPNPAGNNVTIPYSTQLEGSGEVRVLDMLGNTQQVVKTNYAKGLNNLNINVSSLTKGTYIIIVTGADKKLARRYKMIKE